MHYFGAESFDFATQSVTQEAEYVDSKYDAWIIKDSDHRILTPDEYASDLLRQHIKLLVHENYSPATNALLETLYTKLAALPKAQQKVTIRKLMLALAQLDAKAIKKKHSISLEDVLDDLLEVQHLYK